MSKFCENCGAEMDDNQTVCPSCGSGAEATAKQEPISEPTSSNTSAPKSGNAKNIAVIGGIAAAVVVLVAIIVSIFANGWKKPLDNYFKGIEKAKADTYKSAYPDFYVDKYLSKTTDDTLEKQLDSFEEEYGEKIKISYKVTKAESVKKDDLKKVQKYIEKVYDEDVKVSAGKKVKLKITIKGKDDDETDNETMYVYKIDGKWKLFDVSPDTAKDYLD